MSKLPNFFASIIATITREYMPNILVRTLITAPWHDILLQFFQNQLMHDHPLLAAASDYFAFNTPITLKHWLEKQEETKESTHTYHELIKANQIFSDIKKIKLLFLSFDLSHLSAWQASIEILLSSPQYRIILITNSTAETPALFAPFFANYYLPKLDTTDYWHLLNAKRQDLEKHYHTLITEDCAKFAYNLASYYLNPTYPLDAALQLIDSAASELSLKNETETAAILQHAHLLHLLSQWTNIPESHLNLQQHFNADKLMQLEKSIVGQTLALKKIFNVLRYRELHLLPKPPAPLAAFLFAGAKGTGKMSLALALSEARFGINHFTYIAQRPASNTANIFDIMTYQPTLSIQRSLSNLVLHIPFAILVFEDIELWPDIIQQDLNLILTYGNLPSITHNYYHFNQMIIIATCAAVSMPAAIQPEIYHSEPQSLLNILESQTLANSSAKGLEINDHFIHQLENLISKQLYQKLTLIPFNNLEMNSLKQICCLKLKEINQLLMKEHHLSLSYAEEILEFLVHRIKLNTDSLYSGIEMIVHEIYDAIEQCLMSYHSKIRSLQLFLQLNEAGDMLQCHTLVANVG